MIRRLLLRLAAPADVRALTEALESARAELARTVEALKTTTAQLAQATADAASLRGQLAECRADLRVASRENENLWLVCERDRARVQREAAVFARGRAEAEAAVAETLADGE